MRIQMENARLQYVVVPIDKKVKRLVHKLIETKKATMHSKAKFELKVELQEQDGGFLVYFPRGHVLRMKDKKALKQYGLDLPPKIINADDLLGSLIGADTEEKRKLVTMSLEKRVIALATRVTGPVTVPDSQEMEAA